jgi:hypothetical protein
MATATSFRHGFKSKAAGLRELELAAEDVLVHLRRVPAPRHKRALADEDLEE